MKISTFLLVVFRYSMGKNTIEAKVDNWENGAAKIGVLGLFLVKSRIWQY